MIGGGASRVMHDATMAAGADKPFFLELVGSGITATYSLHFAAVPSHARWSQVDCHMIYTHQLIRPAIQLENGLAPVSEAPGLGVELDEDAVSRFRIEPLKEKPSSPPDLLVFGFVDTQNVFSNTGAFIVKSPGGRIFPICSGTLISPTVFLTASHCTAFFEADLVPLGYTAFVSFDNPIPFGDLTSGTTHLLPVTQVVTNPQFHLVGQRQTDPGDIGLLLLRAGDTLGITPAALPTFGLLDVLAAQNGLKDAVFTAVGYGLQNRVNGGGPPFFQDLNPVPRMYAFSSFNALNLAYLHLSQNPATGNGGTCFGDSGGPNFFNYNGTRLLVAITITGDAVCRSTNVVHRLDTASARQFLAAYVAQP